MELLILAEHMVNGHVGHLSILLVDAVNSPVKNASITHFILLDRRLRENKIVKESGRIRRRFSRKVGK